MNDGNTQFLKGILYIIGINLILNLLPYPYGIIAFVGIVGYSLWELWKYTRNL